MTVNPLPPPPGLPGADPSTTADFQRLLEEFVHGAAGTGHALLASSDGLPLLAAGLPRPAIEPVAALITAMISTGHRVADLLADPYQGAAPAGPAGPGRRPGHGAHRSAAAASCDDLVIGCGAGRYLIMRVTPEVTMGALVVRGGNLGHVAHAMSRFIAQHQRHFGDRVRLRLREDILSGTLAP
ncbi:roadblock/LC7 domain-containing protein [Actinomadura parmotrematis]|uniref:Roadblock/LC7 domain-containing protein n=1 Tax=Actinomadura parmotrematis TaxID=2864039 RepID=A0ABS7FQV4_9ACTN|nr:roadblock/LC7 domain-containing protein [Actinomadura parmotrematis]MBW8482774.1 roadblock/LC7 domain-containing protein [Actinomadura parmotrematis]